LAENTTIVFTADHGNMLGDRGRWFKGVAYEGSSRIPLLMKGAANIPSAEVFNRGKVINEIVENVDVMPTLFDMAGLDLPSQGIQGRSMVGLVSGTDKQWKNRAFEERGSLMIRTPQYKLIQNDPKELRRGGGEYELYDLVQDPREEHDLAADPAHARVLEELKAQLKAWHSDVPPVPTIAGLELPTYEAESSAPPPKRGGKRARQKQR
jgi:arylsulfatase A-like enzyme